MKILFAASEAVPFIKTGGLADVAGSLPKALAQAGHEVKVILPLYEGVSGEWRSQMTFLKYFNVTLSWRQVYCGIFQLERDGVTYWFVDNEYYFKRWQMYGHFDDCERFAYFSRAVIETPGQLDWWPDIIHCNDWQSALTPVYYSTMYAQAPGYENIKTIFTIHNIQYQGVYGKELISEVLGLHPEDTSIIEYDGDVNFMKGAIECANRVTTVSPSYANEILDPWYSHGLDTILRERAWKLSGILNGIDTEDYDPATDKDIFAHYSAEDFSAKAENKRALQELMGLPQRADVPLVGMVSRLVGHKGLDLVKAVLDELLSTADVQMVVLGSGEWQYEEFFKAMAAKHPDKLALRLGFVPSLSRKIYAGSDLFLMPSKSEPCGLSQMIALRYGSIPIVRETGGLRDSIRDSGDGEGNGFTFSNYNAHEMLYTIRRALEGYANPDGWKILVKRAMECDNSWGKSANEYIRLYKEVLKD